MSGQWGKYLSISIFGESHGKEVGITLGGLPSGMALDLDAISFEMARRAPGRSKLVSARKEDDPVTIVSGLYRGYTTGTPLTAVIPSTGAHSSDYAESMDLMRPGHADYTGHVRYGGFEDPRGGGHFSGRLTAPLVFAGAVCKQILAQHGVKIYAHIAGIGTVTDAPLPKLAEEDWLSRMPTMALPVVDGSKAPLMEAEILAAKEAGDSVGGAIGCGIYGVPAGLGAPFFDSVESQLSHMLFSIPGVKGVEFGDGFAMGSMHGSECNDAYCMGDEGTVATRTNHSGGILGGVTSGMPILFRTVIRPTASIAKEQDTVSLHRMTEEKISIKGRHDPCIVVRAVPVVEAAAAIVMVELLKERKAWEI